MEVCKELKKIAKEFSKNGYKLYIVGGFVRDSLMGEKTDDIDITSNMPVDDVKKICDKLELSTKSINKHLGTILINAPNRHFEYTQFRSESYSVAGQHTPDQITFVDDINTDCLRRDFTINSIYYDITNDVIVDPVGGQKDLTSGIIRSTRTPQITLSDDGLRILRAIRFASTLGFRIEKNTKKALGIFTPLLNKISKERILKELNQIVIADYKLGRANTLFLTLCNKTKLIGYLFNSIVGKIPKFNKCEIKAFYNLPKESRLIGLYVLVLKKFFNGYSEHNQLGYNINAILGLDGIKESTNHIFTTEKIYRVYQNIVYNVDILNATINYLAFSDAERSIVDAYLNKHQKSMLNSMIDAVKQYHLPLSIHELDITAQDLIEAGIDRKYISKILSTLYNQVLQMSVKNSREDLKTLALEIHNTFKNL